MDAERETTHTWLRSLTLSLIPTVLAITILAMFGPLFINRTTFRSWTFTGGLFAFWIGCACLIHWNLNERLRERLGASVLGKQIVLGQTNATRWAWAFGVATVSAALAWFAMNMPDSEQTGQWAPWDVLLVLVAIAGLIIQLPALFVVYLPALAAGRALTPEPFFAVSPIVTWLFYFGLVYWRLSRKRAKPG